jgi:taurine dioxygenase
MMKVRTVAPKIGAEITGVDVRSMDAATWQAFERAFVDHVVLVVRDQRLEIPDFLAYGARFGTIKPHIVQKSRHPLHPDLTIMDARVLDTREAEEARAQQVLVKRGAVWHTDLSYDYVTAKATLLHAINVPTHGGDTLFQSSYHAYDALPESTRRRIENLSGTYQYGGRLKRGIDLLEDFDLDRPRAVHPLVRIHPESGRKTLYFGDLVIWDNRCSLHAATGDYPLDQRRTLWRATIMEPDYLPREVALRASLTRSSASGR